MSPQSGTRTADDAEALLDGLRSEGSARDAALTRLHELLLRGAHHEMHRRRGLLTDLSVQDVEDLAHQAADDALNSILRKLDTFRGESRFTTWAYKFVIFEAGVKARRRAWQDREVNLDDEGWSTIGDQRRSPEQQAETADLMGAVSDAIRTVLTPRQRQVLVAITLDGIPIDVLAERLDTSRGALYKTLHDARRKLRVELAASGYAVDDDQGGER